MSALADTGAGTPPAPADRPKSGGPGAALTLLGGGTIAIAATLPWFVARDYYQTQYLTGLAPGADGTFFLLVGLMIALIGVVRLVAQVPGWLQLGAGLPALAVGWWATIDFNQISAYASTHSTAQVIGTPGPGLPVTIAGALAVIVGSIMIRESERKS